MVLPAIRFAPERFSAGLRPPEKRNQQKRFLKELRICSLFDTIRIRSINREFSEVGSLLTSIEDPVKGLWSAHERIEEATENASDAPDFFFRYSRDLQERNAKLPRFLVTIW